MLKAKGTKIENKHANVIKVWPLSPNWTVDLLGPPGFWPLRLLRLGAKHDF